MAPTIDQLNNTIQDLTNDIRTLKICQGNVPAVTFPTFDGGYDDKTLGEFLDRFYLYGKINGWDKKRCCDVFPAALSGEALVTYKSLPNDIQNDWEQLADSFQERFNRSEGHRRYLRMLERRSQTNDESVVTYSQAIKKLATRAYPKTYEYEKAGGGKHKPYDDDYIRDKTVDHFLNGLRPHLREPIERQISITNKRPTSLEKALEMALKEERLQREFAEDRLERSQQLISSIATEESTKLQDQARGFRDEMRDMVAAIQRAVPSALRRTPFYRRDEAPRAPFRNDAQRPAFRNPFRGPWRNPFNSRNQQPPRDNAGQQRRRQVRFRDARADSRPQPTSPRTPRRDESAGRRETTRGSFQRGSGYMLPTMFVALALASIVGCSVAQKQLQICSITRGSYFVAPPTKQSCEPPHSDEAHHTIADLYVPKTTPSMVVAYHCSNITTTTCSRSAMFLVASSFQRPTMQRPVSAELCWQMVTTTKFTDNVTLTQEDIDLWRTDREVTVPRRFWGEECRSISNYVVQRGTIGTLDGELLASDLSPHLNCSVLDLQCQDEHGITVWHRPSVESLCRYEPAGTFAAIKTHEHVLVDEIQAAFVFSKNQVVDTTPDLQCLPPGIVRLENEAFALFRTPTEWRLGKPSVKTHFRHKRSIPDDCGDNEPIFKPFPLPPRVPTPHLTYAYNGPPTYRILRRGKSIWYQSLYSDDVRADLKTGNVLIHDNGTREVLQRDVYPKLDGHYWTFNDQPFSWEKPPNPLFPGVCGCQPHRRGWPYVGRRRVFHEQFYERFPEGNLTYDIYKTRSDREISHPCDLPHGTEINYESNGTQLFMFWESKTSFVMLSANVFEKRERQRLHSLQSTSALKRPSRSVRSGSLSEEETRALKTKHDYCRSIDYNDSMCDDIKPVDKSTTTTPSSRKTRPTKRPTGQQPRSDVTSPTLPPTPPSVATRATSPKTPPTLPPTPPSAATRATSPKTPPTTAQTVAPTQSMSPASREPATEEPSYDDVYLPTHGETEEEELPPYLPHLHAWRPPAWKGHRSQNLDAFNTRMQYVEDRMTNETQHMFERLWRQICRVHNMQIDQVMSDMRFDATTGMRQFLRRDDIHASYVGEVLAISACTQVTPSEIMWNRKVNDTCYQDIPVRVNNTVWFIQTGTRDLKRDSPKIRCDHRPVSIYRDHEGIWRTDAGTIAQVASLTHRMTFHGQLKPIDIVAPTIFNSDLARVATSVSALAHYVDRINHVERVLKRITEPRLPSIGTAIEIMGESANETIQTVVSKTTGWFSDMKDVFTEWYHFMYLAVIVLAIVVLTGLALYSLPWIMACCQALRRLRKRKSSSIELTSYHRRPLINAIEPSAPKRNGELVEYYPEGCFNVHSVGGRQLRIRLGINQQPIEALFDTGSSLTFCRESTARDLDALVRHTNQGGAVAANGSRISFLGEFDALIDYGNIRNTFTVLISPDGDCPAPMVLGTDFMQKIAGKKTQVTLDFAKKTVSLGTEELAMLSGAIDLAPTPARVRLLEETVLEPRSDNLLVAYVSPEEYKSSLIPSDPTSTDILLTAANHKYPMVMVGDVVADLDNAGQLPVRVINPGNSKVRIFKNSTLAHAQPVRDVSPVVYDPSVAAVRTECSPTSTYTPPEADWSDKLPQQMPPIAVQLASKLNLDDSILSPDARATLKQIIMRHAKAFVGDDGNIGKYNGPISHRIDMETGAAPFQLRPYRTPLALREEVQRQIEDMLRQGIIRPSASPFCSPIVMVKKADGKSWRFAVDYRKLNSLTVKQTYYLPLIQDILDLVGGKRYYSNFDFQSGFHQIPVFPPHVERTAFATFLGLFEFLRMPFGLCSAPSTFQRVMETMRKELTAAFFIYLDDVVLASDTEGWHLADIEQFLSVIEKYRMRLRLDKCTFGRSEIKYLGFLISEQGMRPDPKNITSIQSIKPAKNLTELRSFIGAVSYFRRFIPNFAGLMKPLYELTKKESLTDWTDTHQQAFETVKQKLSEAPVLASPRFGQPFVVETDASATAIAACLLQEDRNGEIHPVAYASRLLNKHEARYPSVESETLAIVFALREFAPYLEGAGTSTVRTDNSALSSLLQKKDLVGRLAKYQMTIQPFDIKIVHRSGKSNAFCDHLSRYPGHAVNALADIPDSPPLTLENFRESQRDVPEYRILYDALVHDRWPAEEHHRRRVEQLALSYQVHNGTLHYVHPDDEDDIRRILVPYALRTRLIRQFHSSLFEGAHLGTAKIQQKMKTRFYWPGMTDDIAKVVTSCDVCQKRKTASATVSHEPLHMIPVPRHPFDRVHVDFMGPLTTTPRKNKYIMVAVCAFSKWLIAVPTPDQTATTVSTAFVNHVVTQHGVPSRVVTDQGRQFVGTIFNQLADRLHFEHVTTTPYHQQANGMVERQNQTLAAMIAAYAHKQKDQWDQFLPLVTFAFNTSVQESTHLSPFYMLYCREAQLPIDLLLQREPNRTSASTALYIQDVERAMAQAWDAARTAMKANQAEHKRAADLSRHAKEHDFHEHDLVLVYRDAASVEDRHKFRLRWEGPYRIIRVQRPNLIVRLLDEDAPLKEVHMDKAKPYKEDIALPLHALDIAPRPRPNNELLQRARAERELLRRHESHIREPNDANLEVEDNDDDDDLDDDNDDDHEDNNEDDPFPELDPLPEPNAANAPQPGPAAQVQPPPARPPAGIPRRRRNPDDDDPDYDARRARYMPPARGPSTRQAAINARRVWTNSDYP